MSQSASIRPADAADVDTLLVLSKRTIRACYKSFLGDKPVEGYIGSGAVEKYYQDNLSRCFVIEDEGGTGGVGAYKGATVDLMLIDADRHRFGPASSAVRRPSPRLDPDRRLRRQGNRYPDGPVGKREDWLILTVVPPLAVDWDRSFSWR